MEKRRQNTGKIDDINKIVAQKELEFIGGIPKAALFMNDSKNKSIDILKCMDTP